VSSSSPPPPPRGGVAPRLQSVLVEFTLTQCVGEVDRVHRVDVGGVPVVRLVQLVRLVRLVGLVELVGVVGWLVGWLVVLGVVGVFCWLCWLDGVCVGERRRRRQGCPGREADRTTTPVEVISRALHGGVQNDPPGYASVPQQKDGA